MKKYLFWGMLMSYSFSSCFEISEYVNVNNVKVQRIDSLYLSYSHSVNISLDENTPVDWLNTSLIEKNDSIYVLVFNAYIGDLFYYDIHSGNFRGKIETKFGNLDGMSVYDNHEIYLQDYERCSFYRLDNNGEVCDTLRVPFVEGEGISPPSRISIFNGVKYTRNKFFYETFSVGESDRGNRYCGAVLDIENKNCTYIMPYPKIYQKANWGGGMFRSGYTCFNSLKNLILFSFPASHELFVYNIENNAITSFYAGSNCIDIISSYSNNVDERFDDNRSIKHYISNPNYGAIIYDKYRQLYYRIAEIPRRNEVGGYRLLKQLSIIILDLSFRIVGETIFLQPYGTTILVAPDGLMIPFVENNDLDGIMQYHMFKVCVME